MAKLGQHFNTFDCTWYLDNTSALAKIYLHQDHTDNLIIFCWKNIQFENISIESTVFMEDSENKYHNYTFHFFFIL